MSVKEDGDPQPPRLHGSDGLTTTDKERSAHAKKMNAA
jgi:hypothetical protein